MTPIRRQLLVFVVAIAFTTLCSAQTTRMSVTAGRYENEPISLNNASGAPASTTQPALAISNTGELNMGRVALALGLVLAMIFGMVYVGRRFFPSAGVPRSGGAMKILSRLAISPKQQLL